MKKHFTLLLFCSCFFAVAQDISIPDTNFKARLLTLADTNNDGQIQQNEAVALVALDVSTSSINTTGDILTLEGVQYFTSLKELICTGNQLTALDVTMLPSLEKLRCGNNQIENLAIQGLANLKEVWCNNNEITTINTTGLTGLENLFCHVNNLSLMNFQNLPLLKGLKISANNFTSLDLSQLTNLQTLVCSENQLTSLTVENNLNLIEIVTDFNLLTTLNISGLENLTVLIADNNQLTSVELSGNNAIRQLSLNNNPLTTINLNDSSTLKSLLVSGCHLTTIDCSHTGVDQLLCANNPELVSINVQNGVISSSDPDLLAFAFDFTDLPSLTSICFDNGEQINLGGTGFDPEGNVTLYTGENCDEEIFLSLDDKSLTSVTIYPNPFIDHININLNEQPDNVILVDVNGRIIAKPAFVNNGQSLSVNLADVTQNGIYFIRLSYPDKIITEKIIRF